MEALQMYASLDLTSFLRHQPLSTHLPELSVSDADLFCSTTAPPAPPSPIVKSRPESPPGSPAPLPEVAPSALPLFNGVIKEEPMSPQVLPPASPLSPPPVASSYTCYPLPTMTPPAPAAPVPMSCSSSPTHFLPAATTHPLMPTLHAAVRDECRQTSLPFLLLSTPRLPAGSSVSLSVRQASLAAQFAAVQSHSPHSKPHLHELRAFYDEQAASLEAERHSSLQSVQQTTPWLFPSVHSYFDFRQYELIDRVEASLNFLHAECARHARQQQVQRRQQAAASRTTKTSSAASSRRGGSLSVVAVKIMTKWYSQNESHPYPNKDTTEVMAEAGGLTTEQVRKWFCNKRKRSGNTRSLGQIAAKRHRGNQLSVESILLEGTRGGRD